MKRRKLFLIFLLFLVVPPATAQKHTAPIIDVHLHCYSKEGWVENNRPNPITKRPLTAKNDQDHFRETLSQMKKYNIVKGMVSNDYAAALKWHASDAGRFMTGSVITVDGGHRMTMG